LRQLTDVEKVVRIDSITIDARGFRSQYTLRYTDLTTGLPDSVRF
jgi:hypothetical protein